MGARVPKDMEIPGFQENIIRSVVLPRAVKPEGNTYRSAKQIEGNSNDIRSSEYQPEKSGVFLTAGKSEFIEGGEGFGNNEQVHEDYRMKTEIQDAHNFQIGETDFSALSLLSSASLTEYGGTECEECGKRFTYQSHLMRHRRVHTGEKPFCCGLCKRSFSESSNLKTHIRRVHSRIREHPCPICSKSFAVRGDLTKHIRVHTKERPFSCEICCKGFSDRSNLTQHRKIHIGEKPFICQICKKYYSRRSSLARHLKRFHDSSSPITFNEGQMEEREL